MFAGMLFMVHPFFHGKDNYDQLVKITKVLGTDALSAYLSKYNLKLESYFDDLMGTYPRKPWEAFINDQNRHLCSPAALDLLHQLLSFDHQARPTCQEAMAHPYFAQVRKEELERNNKAAATAAANTNTNTNTDVEMKQ